jgi:glycosyltransferase involved in cell wall biosynthesis
MASGLPVVTSSLAGAADFMNDGVDCLLLNDPRDINELTAKIELLLSNAKLRKTMGERARKAAEKLSWDTVAEKTLEVYNSVLRLERRAI